MLYKEPNKPDAEKPASPPAVTPPDEPLAKPPDDDLVQRLRTAARRNRPRGPLYWALTTLLVGIPTGLLVWLFWPRPLPPELLVIGFDAVASTDKIAIVRAATEPAHGRQPGESKHWAGQAVYFQEVGLAWDKPDKVRQAQTNTQGIAELTWPAASQAGTTLIDVLYVDERRFRRWYDRAQIRLFTWPRDARILVIDTEPTLRNAGDWSELAKALTHADKTGWHIIYLAPDTDNPQAYSKSRNWIMEQSHLPEDPLIVGPVLARSPFFNGESEAAARKRVMAQLKLEFTGTVYYLSSVAGLKLHMVEESGDHTGKQADVGNWLELHKALSK